MNSNSKVYLIGAGPGNPELLTIKAAQIIKECEVLIYDNLVNINIVNLANDKCERIYVGKKANQHTLKQNQINELILKKAKENKTVVRLKGGDPFVFGRGGEEAEYLKKHDILFELVPGITSAIAVPMYAGIPVTHRNYNSAFMVLTGHEDPCKDNSSINWKNIAEFNGTLIILMGIKRLQDNVSNLLKAGKNSKTPTAIIHAGTSPFQKVITGNLANIVNLAKKHKIKPPAIFVVGDVVNLRHNLKWFEYLPLFGKNILITRAKNLLTSIKQELEALGANVICLPTIDIIPSENIDEIFTTIQQLEKFNWLIFTSSNGVKFFFDQLHLLKLDSRALGSIKIAAIGTSTDKELSKYGIKADFIPDKFLSEELIEKLDNIYEIKNKHFLLARSDIARKEITNSLLKKGASVKDLVVYKTVLPEIDINELELTLEKYDIDILTFTSPSTVENFIQLIPKNLIDKILYTSKIASIGPITTQKTIELLGKADIEATVHTTEGLIKSIVEFYTC